VDGHTLLHISPSASRWLLLSSSSILKHTLALSLLQVSRSSLVLDPYVGTGSILIAAAARGAHTMGCDIDVRVLKHGRKCPKTGKQVRLT
jgi:predicted RNA methylase